MRKLRLIALATAAVGLGPAGCVADPMVPCGSFDAGQAEEGLVVRAREGAVAVVAMRDTFLLRNVCDSPTDCHVERERLPELAPGSQVMLTTDGSALVGINQEDGRVWKFGLEADGFIHERKPVHTTEGGPAQLVIGLRNSGDLIVRDHDNHLGVYHPGDTEAARIAPSLGDYLRLAAVGHDHVAVRVFHSEHSQTVYVVQANRGRADMPYEVATGDFTSVVFSLDDRKLVLSEGRGTDASVLVFDVPSHTLVDAFAGDLVSSIEQNEHRAIDQVPGMHAVSPGGEHIAYRTTSGALAVRATGQQSSCLVRNTNRLGTGSEGSRRAGQHTVAGFSSEGILFAEYNVGAGDSFVYAYDPLGQQIVPLGTEQEGWHLAAIPGDLVSDQTGEIERLWAVGVHHGRHATIAEGRVDGQSIGEELTFMPLADAGVWAVDTADEVEGSRQNDRALSVRRVAPPQWADGRLRFEQGPEEQVITVSEDGDNAGPLRVPLTGRMCLTTGSPGAWAYRCGDASTGRDAITTNSGQQEQTNDPNSLPEFDPPFPEQEEEDEDDESPPGA